MSPRNLDDNCKDKSYSEDPQDCQYFLPSILHKKHKVIKLVKAQLLSLQEQRWADCFKSPEVFEVNFQEPEFGQSNSETGVNSRPGQLEYMHRTQNVEEFETAGMKSLFLWFIILLITTFLLLLTAAWLSAGPLSYRAPHTPIPWSSLIKTDGICELERKYLLRWSMSNYVA